MSFWRLFFISNPAADKMRIYDRYTEKLCALRIYGSARCISRSVAARKSITIATHIAQVVRGKKLSAAVEDGFPVDSSPPSTSVRTEIWCLSSLSFRERAVSALVTRVKSRCGFRAACDSPWNDYLLIMGAAYACMSNRRTISAIMVIANRRKREIDSK